MAHYIAYASKSRAAQPRELMAEVINMLEAAVWAIPHSTQLPVVGCFQHIGA